MTVHSVASAYFEDKVIIESVTVASGGFDTWGAGVSPVDSTTNLTGTFCFTA